jgi:hypothetical protein
MSGWETERGKREKEFEKWQICEEKKNIYYLSIRTPQNTPCAPLVLGEVDFWQNWALGLGLSSRAFSRCFTLHYLTLTIIIMFLSWIQSLKWHVSIGGQCIVTIWVISQICLVQREMNIYFFNQPSLQHFMSLTTIENCCQN